jgi:hypothetical protein
MATTTTVPEQDPNDPTVKRTDRLDVGDRIIAVNGYVSTVLAVEPDGDRYALLLRDAAGVYLFPEGASAGTEWQIATPDQIAAVEAAQARGQIAADLEAAAAMFGDGRVRTVANTYVRVTVHIHSMDDLRATADALGVDVDLTYSTGAPRHYATAEWSARPNGPVVVEFSATNPDHPDRKTT